MSAQQGAAILFFGGYLVSLLVVRWTVGFEVAVLFGLTVLALLHLYE